MNYKYYYDIEIDMLVAVTSLFSGKQEFLGNKNKIGMESRNEKKKTTENA